ncbi:MAG: M20 family metallopeptidase [Candidatus Eisenbacteria bacterium]
MSTATFRPVFAAADLEELVTVRRDLHAHPETAFEEVRTSGIVTERLRALGLTPRTGVGRTGVVAMVSGGRPGRTVMLRADMDALPIHEENTVAYRSTVDGKMHACGHDCHTSILLAVTRRLVQEADEMGGSVKLCFQPAEESGGGAEAMIADGVLDDPRPDAAFGLHVWQDLDLGKVGVTPGPFMAAVDEFTVTVTGKGAHAAMPQEGLDPVLCLAHMVTALQSIVSRETDPFREVVVSVTQLRAGTAFNIIPATATMNGTVRVFDADLWAALPGRFERIVYGVAQTFGCQAEIRYVRYNRPTINDAKMAAIAHAVAAEVVGEANVVTDLRTMGGEDFSSFLHRIPGCFVAVGSRNAARGLVHGHHHPRFDVDEGCLATGAEILLRITRRYLAT